MRQKSWTFCRLYPPLSKDGKNETFCDVGKTEGNIASALNIKVTKVRSAKQSLERYGFDVMKGERRDTFAASQGRATQAPRVRLGDPI